MTECRRAAGRRSGRARPRGAAAVIFDAHMHVGEFPLFDVSLDRDGPRGAHARARLRRRRRLPPGQRPRRRGRRGRRRRLGPVLGEPAHARLPGRGARAPRAIRASSASSSTRSSTATTPTTRSVHPLYELLVERGLPVLIHCGHPIFTLPWSIEEAAVAFPAAHGDPRAHGPRQHRLHQRRDRRGRAEPQRLPRDVGDADAHQDPRGGRARGPRPGALRLRRAVPPPLGGDPEGAWSAGCPPTSSSACWATTPAASSASPTTIPAGPRARPTGRASVASRARERAREEMLNMPKRSRAGWRLALVPRRRRRPRHGRRGGHGGRSRRRPGRHRRSREGQRLRLEPAGRQRRQGRGRSRRRQDRRGRRHRLRERRAGAPAPGPERRRS